MQSRIKEGAWRDQGNKFIGGNEEIFKFGFNLPITFS